MDSEQRRTKAILGMAFQALKPEISAGHHTNKPTAGGAGQNEGAVMERKNNGGEAFPSTGPVANRGMTLRDYFAAKALNLIGASPAMFEALVIDSQKKGTQGDLAPVLAEFAYSIADAMLVERAK